MSDMLSAILSASAGPVAIFTDFDGTLVEIAPSPDAVVVPSDLPLRLENLHAALDGAFAVITGRTIADIDGFLPDQTLPLIGSHGAEWRTVGRTLPPDPALLDEARSIARQMQESLGDESGILIEAKPTGVAVHYRAAPEKKALARAALGDVLAKSPDFHAIDGKKVIEARPRGTDKGAALDALMQVKPFAGRLPIFIGDDVTDEDGFLIAQDHGGFGVKIGPGDTAARFRLPDIASVYRYFDALIGRFANTPARPSRGTIEESMVK